jgi:hypothetical protein
LWSAPNNNKPHPSALTWLEGDRSYTLVTDATGHKTFTVKGKDGKTIFEGPVNSADELGKVPGDLKEKLDKLQKRTLPFRLPETNPSAPKPDADKK